MHHKKKSYQKETLNWQETGAGVEITTLNLTLNSPKFSSPGSWKDPQLPNWIPERKKFRVKVAAMEQKSWKRKKKKGTTEHSKIKTGTVSSLRLMPGEEKLRAFSSFRKIALLRFNIHSLLQKTAGLEWTPIIIWFAFPHKKSGISSTCLLCLLPKDWTAKSPGTKALLPSHTKSAACRAAPQFHTVPDSPLLLVHSNSGALRGGKLSPARRAQEETQDNLNALMDKPSQRSNSKRHTERAGVTTHHFPCKSLVPEGGTFFQAEKSAPNWGSKGSRNPCSSSSGHKIPFIPEMKRKTISV